MTEHFRRLREIAAEGLSSNLELADQNRLSNEIFDIQRRIEACFDAKVHDVGHPTNQGLSKGWFMEKVAGATSFTEMAVNPSKRAGYEVSQISTNIAHYSSLADSNFASW